MVSSLQSGWNFIQKIWWNRNLIRNLVIRELRGRYVGSVMGFFWSVLHPLFMIITFTFIFSGIFKVRIGPEEGVTSFAVYLFCGILPWNMFSETISRNTSVIIEHSNLVTRTIFPAEILPFSIMAANLISHFIGLALLIVITMLVFGKVIGLTSVFFLIYLLGMCLFTLGLSWILCSLQVFLRDTAQIIIVVLQFWFWFTPIFYTSKAVPKFILPLFYLNPMAYVVSGYRDAFLLHKLPRAQDLPLFLILCLVTCVLGGVVVKKAKYAFPDVL